ETGGGIEPLVDMSARQRRRSSGGSDLVGIVYGRPVVAARERQVPDLAEGERIRGIHAPRADPAVQIDARVERHAVLVPTRDAVGKRVQPGHAAIRIEIAELARLPEAHLAFVPRGTGRELVAVPGNVSEQGELAGKSPVLLTGIAAIQKTVALLRR